MTREMTYQEHVESFAISRCPLFYYMFRAQTHNTFSIRSCIHFAEKCGSFRLLRGWEEENLVQIKIISSTLHTTCWPRVRLPCPSNLINTLNVCLTRSSFGDLMTFVREKTLARLKNNISNGTVKMVRPNELRVSETTFQTFKLSNYSK